MKKRRLLIATGLVALAEFMAILIVASQLFPVVVGAFAVNAGKLLIAKELIERNRRNASFQIHASQTARNWVHFAERFTPTAQSTRVLAFEIGALQGSSVLPNEDMLAQAQSSIQLEGTVLWYENRPVNRFTQYSVFLDMAEGCRRRHEWKDAVHWYWRLFALFPGLVSTQAKQDYYDALGHTLVPKAENAHYSRLSIMASKSYWMAGNREAAVNVVNNLIEREDLSAKDRAWVEFVLGVKTEHEGNLSEALRYYKQSLKTTEAFPFAVFQQPKLAASNEILEQWKTEWTKVAFPPENREVTQIRYILDQDVLSMGLEVPVVLLWELPDNASIDPGGFEKSLAVANGIWLTYGIAENHIRNGGFEWVISSEPNILLGWSHGEVTRPAPLRVTDPETGMNMYVGRFSSKDNGMQTIYLADRTVRLDPNSYSVGGAQIRIVSSSSRQIVSGWIGVWWPDSIGWLTAWDKQEWFTGQLIVKSPDSSTPARIGLWVIPSNQSIGEVLVDNAWLVQLPNVVVQ